jgi:hypothetical protein
LANALKAHLLAFQELPAIHVAGASTDNGEIVMESRAQR